MHTGILLGVGILDQDDLRIRLQIRNLGQLDEVVDAVSVELEMEASVLEGAGQLDDRLTDILDLFLAGDLNSSQNP